MTVKGIYKDTNGNARFHIDISFDAMVTLKASLESTIHFAENGECTVDSKILDRLKNTLKEVDYTTLDKDKHDNH